MKTTFRLMGIADWITRGNGLLGTLSIVFLILAFDGFASKDDSHLSESVSYTHLTLPTNREV